MINYKPSKKKKKKPISQKERRKKLRNGYKHTKNNVSKIQIVELVVVTIT